MAYLQYEGVGITAMAAAVPKRVIVNREYTEVFTKEGNQGDRNQGDRNFYYTRFYVPEKCV